VKLIAAARKQVNVADTAYEKEKLQDRIAKLSVVLL
jgi:hypothetical protein